MKIRARSQLLIVSLVAIYASPVFGIESPAQKTFMRDVRAAMIADNWQEGSAVAELYLREHKADALAHAVKGYFLMQQEQDKSAVPHFNDAIKGGVTALSVHVADSHANNLWSLRGYSSMRSGKLAEGMKDLEKSLDIKPQTCLDILNQRIDCLNLSVAYAKIEKQQKSGALKSAADLMEKQYQQVFYPPVKTAADAKYNAGKLSNDLKAQPASTILTCKLAAYQMYLKNWQDALKNLDKACAAEPYLMQARLKRAICLKKLGRSVEANKEFALVEKNQRAGTNVWNVDKKKMAEAKNS